VKAVAVTEYGGPEVLRLVDLPEPHAGPGQVRIRVHAAVVNPADTPLRIGDADEAATVPMNGLTARRALDVLSLPPGASIAITGAAGAVGSYAVELAKADGLQVIADTAAADVDLVRGLGPSGAKGQALDARGCGLSRERGR
jgi:NADPH:quinone reductase-like Zn-dependent oxidoreductase